MKLTLKIKLLPDENQKQLLFQTMKEANETCNLISEVAFNEKVFNQFKLHHKCYHNIKEKSNLSSQMIVRCISKVANSYKLNKKVQAKFNIYGAIAYDNRILTYKKSNIASIWTIDGRQNIPFVCHNANYLPFIKGEADLVYKKDKFYLFQTVDILDSEVDDIEEFIGVDFGILNLATTSDGIIHSADWINHYRIKQQNIRSSIQSKGTKESSRSTKRNIRRLLKRLSGKERTTGTIINHTISKSIVKQAKEQNKGICIEDLTNIRNTSKRRNKTFRTKLNKWSFYQLRSFLEYKSKMRGVKLLVIPPAYTSQTCSNCLHIGERNNQSFKCNNCNNSMNADYNAAINISNFGVAINQPEKSAFFCKLGLKSSD